MANFFKKIGKKLKKVGKKLGKLVSKVAPIAAFIPGVGTAVAAIAGGVGGKLSQVLGKGGSMAQATANKLGQVKKILDSGQSGAPKPVTAEPPPEAFTTVEQPAPAASGTSSGPPTPSGSGEPQRSGMDPKMLLIAGGALLGIILLTRKR